MGGVATLIGASLPSIVREMDWSYRVAGILLAGNAGAYFVSTLISGWFLGRWGARQLMVLGLLQQGVGIFLFGWTSQWTVAVGLLVWVGFGQGMLEVSANGSVILMDTSGSGRLMNLLHAGFTGGGVLVPALTALLLGHALSWRLAFLSCGVASIVAGAFACRCVFPRMPTQQEAGSIVDLRQDSLIGAFSFAILLYVGIEMGVSSWIGELYVMRFGGDLAAAPWMVSVFWVGILLGRIGMGMGYRGTRHFGMLVLFSTVSLVGGIGTLVASRPTTLAMAVFLMGVGLSVLYPIVMVIVGQRYPRDHGSRIGLVAAGGGLGALVFPLIMGEIAEGTSVLGGFCFFVSMTGVMLVTFMGVRLRLSPRD
tara:strand:- start:21 stop:1121 length:1101 start_codon:yes stop_codon:yes gene_type:complete